MLLFARISLAYLACCSAPSYHNVWPALCAGDFAIWSSQSASTYPASSRYIHAKQFKRANRELKFLRTRLGRLMRDIRRKIAADQRLGMVFAEPLGKALRIWGQNQHQRGPKLYSWHAPEVECIGKGKPHKPYEFGVKVSITTTNRREPRAASSSFAPRRCPAILMTGIPWPR